MKKIIALLIFICAGAALFAQTVKLSVGGGGNLTVNWTSYMLNSDYQKALDDAKQKDYSNSSLFGGGFYAFFDATYVEANVGVLFGAQKLDPPNPNIKKDPNVKYDATKGYEVTALKLGLFGKYPFEISGAFSVFPMIGLDVMIPLGGKMSGVDINDDELKNSVKPKDLKRDYFDEVFTQVWVKFGVGVDINATDHVFVRPEFLYGIRVANNKLENDQIGKYDPNTDAGAKRIASGIVGHGLDIRIAVGYRF